MKGNGTFYKFKKKRKRKRTYLVVGYFCGFLVVFGCNTHRMFMKENEKQ